MTATVWAYEPPLANAGRSSFGRMLEAVTATGGMRVRPDEVPLVAALLLVGDGASPTELATRFSVLCSSGNDQVEAAVLLGRLAELGLVRMIRQNEEKHYVLTVLGEQHAQATFAGQAELAGGLAALERLRTDLLATVAHELRTPLTAVRTSIGILLDRSVDPEPELRARDRR